MSLYAEVVKWQTRTFEGRVAQAVRVQVPPSAPNSPIAYSDPKIVGARIMAQELSFFAHSVHSHRFPLTIRGTHLDLDF